MPGKRDVFQTKYIGKDYVAFGSSLILNKEVAWKTISRRARRAIESAKKIAGLTIEKKVGTKEDVDLFRTVWYDPHDPDLGEGGFSSTQHVYFAYLDEVFVAGIIVNEAGPNLFLQFNGAGEEGKKLQIPSLMIWHIVEAFEGSRFAYLDIGCSFRESLQEYFKNWATHEYPIIFHAPDLQPAINVTPFDTSSMAVSPDPSVDVDAYIATKVGNRPYNYFPRGKHAIFAVLKHLKLEPTDEIFVTTTTGSPYLSIGVSTTIEAVCRWSRTMTPNTKAIFMIHEFGFVHPKAREIQAMAKEKGISLIEDCAYAWNSGDAGTYGDYVIYSFPKFFPVQYGGLLVGTHFTDEEIWGELKCLDVFKIALIKSQLSSYVHAETQIAQKRIENYTALEVLFAESGFESFFVRHEREVPAVYMLKVENEERMKAIAERVRSFGIECGAYYHNNAIFLPIHQNLSRPHLEYMYGAVRSMYRHNNGIYSPEYFDAITQTKREDRNDTGENDWVAPMGI